MDTISKSVRSRVMAAIRSSDTKPELLVRSLAHRMGYRFRLRARDLPGTPDLVFRARRRVILVHGCFWHQHQKKSCPGGRAPKSNLRYWAAKLARNVERDAETLAALKALGWRTLVIWECEAEPAVAARLRRFLGPAGA